jgi:26S proteasome non-ATPase regulatory subunit 5
VCKCTVFLSDLGVKAIISAIDGRLRLESQDLNECESALEALGQIGSCKY